MNFVTTTMYQPSPHVCPVCNGHGTVTRPPWVAGDASTWAAAGASDLYPCHACAGKGLVWPPQNIEITNSVEPNAQDELRREENL